MKFVFNKTEIMTYFLTFIALASTYFWTVNSIAYAAVSDGIIIYDETAPTTNAQSRSWTQASGTIGPEISPFVGSGTSKYLFAKGSPTRKEMILGIEDSAGALTIYRSINNGASWAVEWSATVGDGNLRRFDIAYEQISGNALVVYSANVATTNELRYRTWNGTSWSGELNLDPIRTSGIAYGVKLAERSGSNEIGLVWADAVLALSSNLWTGSSWYGEPSVALTTALAKVGTGTVPTNRSYDLAFETISGDLMVIWGIDATALPRYVIKPAGGAWGATQTGTNLIEEPTMLDIASSPISDKIAYVNATDNGSDCDFAVWSGSAWGTAANDTTCGVVAAGYSGNNVAWLIDGVNEVAILTYNDAAGGGIDWYQSTNGAIPVAQTDNTSAPAIAGLERAGFASVSPSDSRQGLFLFEDANADIFVKKASLSGTTIVWTSMEPGGVALETSASVIGFNPVAFAYVKFEPNALIVDINGTQAVNLVSGATAQHIGGGSTAAFTLQVVSSATVSSVRLSDTGTVSFARLTTPRLYYENVASCAYNGTESNTSGAYTGESVTFSLSSVPIGVSPNMTCLYFVFDIDGGATGTKGGEIIDVEITNPSADVVVSGASNNDAAAKALSGSTIIKPNATSVTYGAGLSDGGRSGETIIISGFGFGVAPALSRANCAGGIDTGCTRFIAGGNATLADSDISAWSNTSITFTISTTIASQGGTASLEVVSGSQNDTSVLTFYVYPNIVGMITCSSGGDRNSPCGTNAAQEYVAADTYGLIQLNGDHFGVPQGTAQFTGAFGGLTGTIHGTAEGPCTSAGWGISAICVEVYSLIADNVYDGTVTISRNNDSKTDAIDLRILPRIITNTPIADVAGNVITIDGNHFCQTGVCPGAPPTADYIAYFGSTQALLADFVASCSGGSRWSHTQVCVKVPIGTPSGIQKTKIQGSASPLYESERSTFTVQTSMPNDPVNLLQFKSDGSTLIPLGLATNESSVVLKADLSASIAINMALQIEVKNTSALFDGIGIVEGTVLGGGACTLCASLTSARVTVLGLTDETKHWRARVRNITTNEYSNWVSFGGNLETETDFIVDTTPPDIRFPGANTCSDPGTVTNAGTNSATINWSLSNESADGQVEYSINSDLSFSTIYPVLPAASSTSHSIPLSNLNSGTTYYFKVKSKDSVGNLGARPSVSPFCLFTTGSVTQPGKTTSFLITSVAAPISGASGYYFSVLAPENGISVKNSYIEATALVSGGVNPISVQINGVTVKNYSVDAASPTLYTFVYPISNPESESNLNLNDALPCTNGVLNLPPCNKLTITPGGGMTLYTTSAKIVMMYGYTP